MSDLFWGIVNFFGLLYVLPQRASAGFVLTHVCVCAITRAVPCIRCWNNSLSTLFSVRGLGVLLSVKNTDSLFVRPRTREKTQSHRNVGGLAAGAVGVGVVAVAGVVAAAVAVDITITDEARDHLYNGGRMFVV